MRKIVPINAILIPDGAKCVFKGVVFSVYQWQQELFDGSKATFEMLKRADTVKTIGIVDDKILAITDEQPNRQARLTFPGGRVDEDELTLDAAKREMLEETGYKFDSWRLVKVWQPEAKIEWFFNLFVAWNGRKVGEQSLDAGEKISVRVKSFEKTCKIILNGPNRFGEAGRIFEQAKNIQDILASPEFAGKEIVR